MTAVIDDGTRGATLSPCGTYRYDLWRRWGPGPVLWWVMLNPSTADADADDATVRRCIGFARREGYAGIGVRNLFALRATNPRDLVEASDPVGPWNDESMEGLCDEPALAPVVVAAWGRGLPALRRVMDERATALADRLGDRLWTLHPSDRQHAAPHPLRLRADTPLVPYPAA